MNKHQPGYHTCLAGWTLAGQVQDCLYEHEFQNCGLPKTESRGAWLCVGPVSKWLGHSPRKWETEVAGYFPIQRGIESASITSQHSAPNTRPQSTNYPGLSAVLLLKLSHCACHLLYTG